MKMLVAFIGETGVGKSTIMRMLHDARKFIYVRNVTTRYARFGEYHKTTIAVAEFNKLAESGELDLVNVHFDRHYAYIKSDIDHAILSIDYACMIDFGIENINQLDRFPNTKRIIILPDSKEVLRKTVVQTQRGRNPEEVLERYEKNYGHLAEGVNDELEALVVRNVYGDPGATAYKVANYLITDPTEVRDGASTRRERLHYILENIRLAAPARNGLEAYQLVTRAIDDFEDKFAQEDYSPPRTFLDGGRSSRMYTIFPESFHPVPNYHGVMLLLSKHELMFVSKNGAIEIQYKDRDDLFGQTTHFKDRTANVFFRKEDFGGNGVWHASNE